MGQKGETSRRQIYKKQDITFLNFYYPGNKNYFNFYIHLQQRYRWTCD